MYKQLTTLNIELSNDKIEFFNKYISLFLEYNDKVNLISNNDVKLLFQKHIFDSLALNLFFKKYNCGAKVLDIGTGGGFPALPLSIAFESLNITAVDSIKKKINFLHLVKDELQLVNLNPKCSRIEELPVCLKNSFDVVTTRAMSDLREILEYAIPFVKTDGYFVAYKSIKADEELHNAKNALKVLNTVLVEKIEYKLPLDENNTRVLLVFKKTKNILDCYPRKNGLIKKKPL